MVSLLLLLLIPAFAIVNHIRGGGGLLPARVAALLDKIPGNGDMHAAPFVALMAWLAGFPALSAALFALCWLAWSTPAWGFLQGLGRGPGPTDVRAPSWYEALFLKTENPWVAFGLRTTLFLIPMALCFGWPWLLLGPLQVAAYEIGWRLRQPGIAYGEIMTGALWGAFLFAASL